MKNIILFAFLLCSITAVSQTADETIKKSNQLITDKKYDSAFNLLEKADPANDNLELVLAKQDIVLQFFVTSIMHKMFALKDLQANEVIEDYRGKNGSFSMHVFAPDSLLNRLIKTNPNNYKLYRGLGNYYYEAYLHYGANWTESAETLYKYIEDNYTRAIDLHDNNYMTYYELGYIYLVQKKYPEAKTWLLKSTEANANYGNAAYNLAYAYLFQDDRQNAVKYAIKSVELYQDKGYKADAARMVGQIYTELKDSPNAIRYYEASDQIEPKNYYTLKSLLATCVTYKNAKEASALNNFYLLAPDKPTIYNDLREIYADKPTTLREFYEGKLATYTKDMKVYGNLNFYLAQLYLVNSEKPKAKASLAKAKTAFLTIFDDSNAVFKAIDKLEKDAE